MTKPAEPGSTVGKRLRTPTTRGITGRPSTVRAISSYGHADASAAASVSSGTGNCAVGCAGRTPPGVPMAEKPTIATASLVAGPVVAADPTPRQAPSETGSDGPRAGSTTSGPSATRAED